MRLILVDATRVRLAAKRNGGVEPVSIEESMQVVSGDMTLRPQELQRSSIQRATRCWRGL